MGIERDTAFKFIGKNALEVLMDLANLSETVDASTIEEVTEELISLKISQLRPDFIGRNDDVICMFEYESSIVGIYSKKRFHAYVALFDFEKNKENRDIIFCVISTKEESKIIEHKIGNTDSFKIIIFNIRDLGFEEIINNAEDKIENSECFSLEDLVKLALTSLMPGTHEGNVKQFYKLADMMDGIIFEDEDAKISFCGLVLLLSNIYFDVNDSAREKIQGVFMGKVDCIVEMRQKEYDAGRDAGRDEGFEDGLLEAVRVLLKKGFSVFDISQDIDLPIDRINELKNEIESSN
jgi:hypothetical protein